MSDDQLKTPTAVAPDGTPRSSRADVLDFLDSLDNYSTPAPSQTPTISEPALVGEGPAAPASAEDAQSVLDFLDEITQRSSTPTAAVPKRATGANPSLSRSGSRTNVLSAVGVSSRLSGESIRSRSSPASDSPVMTAAALPEAVETPPVAVEGGWGWSSVWNATTTIVQQAREVAEEQVKTASSTVSGATGLTGGIGGIGEGLMKALGENEQAKKWGEGVIQYARAAHLDQLGKDLKSQTLRSLTELLNAVAPPIAEHEVIKVSLSHDMIGYDGVETLVYRGLAKIMDQIEGGTLIVNKGDAEKPVPATEDPDERNLNYVEGLAEGWKLAEANLDQLIKGAFSKTKEEPRANSVTVPVTTCPIFMRIQPCLAPLPFLANPTDVSSDAKSSSVLFFLLLLRDPTHNLVHSSLSQSIPASWLDIPFEENEWVEDVMVDVIRRGVEVIGQEYISHRMRAQTEAIGKAREAAQLALEQQSPAAKLELAAEAERKEDEAAEAVAAARATV